MGTSSRDGRGERVHLCVFDSRRGQQEGEEMDKILYFFPADSPLHVQLSLVGLSEGLITFTRTFSPQAACEIIESDKHSHVFHQSERDIWMVLVLEKGNDLDPIGRTDSLQHLLKELHSLFVTFFEPLRTLLEKHPDGYVARGCLNFFVTDYLSDFLVGSRLHMPSFRDCLRERGTIQMLPMGRETAIEVQSLVRLLESRTANITCNSIVMFHDLLVSSTLSPEDTTNIFTYASLRLTPNVISSSSNSWSYLRKGVASSHVSASLFSLNSKTTMIEDNHAHDNSSPSKPLQKVLVPRPLLHNKWRKGKDGFLVTDAWGAEIGSMLTPKVWLFHGEDCMHLLVHQYKNLTILLFVSVGPSVSDEQAISLVKQQILEIASLQILKIEKKLSKEWGGINASHVSGYRYLLLDNDTNTSRASPPGKVTTLSKGSLLALSKLRGQIDLEKKRAQQDDPEHDKDVEVCIRADNNAWVIARLARGKELYMALEKAGETLLYASDAVMKFSDRYCNGVFSLD